MSDTQSFLTEKRKSIAAIYWGGAMGFALAFFLVTAGLAGIENYVAPDYDRALLAPIAAHSDSAQDLTAVMLGNSRLRYGVTFGFEPDIPLELEDGRRLWAVQYAKNVATFQHYKDIWPDIVKSRPDYIILQAALFSSNYNLDIGSIKFLSNITYNWFERWIINRDPREEWERTRYDIRDSCYKNYTNDYIQSAIIRNSQRDRHDLDNNPSTGDLRKAIAEALAAGIKVIIIRIPANDDVLQRFGVPGHIINHYGLGYTPTREQLLPELYGQVTWLDYEAPDTSSYCDISHMGAKGRAGFSEWLLDSLSRQR